MSKSKSKSNPNIAVAEKLVKELNRAPASEKYPRGQAVTVFTMSGDRIIAVFSGNLWFLTTLTGEHVVTQGRVAHHEFMEILAAANSARVATDWVDLTETPAGDTYE